MSTDAQKPSPPDHSGNSAARIRQLFLFGLLLIALSGLVWEFVIIKPRFNKHNGALGDMLAENQAAGRDALVTDAVVHERLEMEPAVVKDVNDTHKLEVFRYRRGIPIRFYSLTVGYTKVDGNWMIVQKWENDEQPPESDWVQDVIFSDIQQDELPNDLPSGAGGTPRQGGNAGGGQGGGQGGGRPEGDDSDDDDSDDDDSDDSDSGDGDSGDGDSGDGDSGDGDSGDGDSGDGDSGDGDSDN